MLSNSLSRAEGDRCIDTFTTRHWSGRESEKYAKALEEGRKKGDKRRSPRKGDLKENQDSRKIKPPEDLLVRGE